MSQFHPGYEQARAAAQKKANRLRLPVGIYRAKEFGRQGFQVKLLPGRSFRQGHELNAEEVLPETIRRDEQEGGA